MADDRPVDPFTFLYWRHWKGIIYFVVRTYNLTQQMPEDALQLPSVPNFYHLHPEAVAQSIGIVIRRERPVFLVAQKKRDEYGEINRDVGNIGYWALQGNASKTLFLDRLHIGSKDTFEFRIFVEEGGHRRRKRPCARDEPTPWKITEYSTSDNLHNHVIICLEYDGPAPNSSLRLEGPSNQGGGPSNPSSSQGPGDLGPSSSNQALLSGASQRQGGFSGPRIGGPRIEGGARIIGRGARRGILGRNVAGHPQIQANANEGQRREIARGSSNLAPPNVEESSSFPRQIGNLQILGERTFNLEGQGNTLNLPRNLAGSSSSQGQTSGSQGLYLDWQSSPNMTLEQIDQMINEFYNAPVPNPNLDGANPDDRGSGDNPNGTNPDGGGGGDSGVGQ